MRLSSKSENKFATAAATRSASRAILSPTAEAPSHPKAAVNPIGTLRPHRRLYLQTTQKLLPRPSHSPKREITRPRIRSRPIRSIRPSTSATAQHFAIGQQSSIQATFRRAIAARHRPETKDRETV